MLQYQEYKNMEQLNVVQKQNISKRNRSFCKHANRKSAQQMQEMLPNIFPQVKTVKLIKKKANSPVLNLEEFNKMLTTKHLLLKQSQTKKFITQRKQTRNHSEDASFILPQFDAHFNKKTPNIQANTNQLKRKSSVLPPIKLQSHTTPLKLNKHSQANEQNMQGKRKPLRMKVHCKVLLGRHSDFPFIGSNVYEYKKTDRVRTKQSSNPQSLDLFDLDISRISQIEQLKDVQFISKDSLQQIKIF